MNAVIIRSSPCDSLSYAEFFHFHFRIFNCMLVNGDQSLTKNPKTLHANMLLLYMDISSEKGDISVKFRKSYEQSYLAGS